MSSGLDDTLELATTLTSRYIMCWGYAGDGLHAFRHELRSLRCPMSTPQDDFSRQAEASGWRKWGRRWLCPECAARMPQL